MIEADKSRRRGWLMQAVLCALLGATVALASAVQHYRMSALRPVLDGPLSFETLKISLRPPRGWTWRMDVGAVVFDRASNNHHPARTLRIGRQRTRVMLSPLEFLDRADLLRGADPSAVHAVTVAGWPGLIVHPGTNDHRYLAVAVLPTREIVSVQLDCGAGPDAGDLELVQKVVESLVLDGLPSPRQPPQSVELPGGIGVTIPAHFLALPAGDAYRENLQLVSDQYTLSVEFVPCFLLNEDSAPSFAAMIAARDPMRASVKIDESKPRRWAARTTSIDKLSQTYDYLLFDESREALLVSFHGDRIDPAVIESNFNTIAASVRFTGKLNIVEPLEAGARASVGIRANPPKLLADASEQWTWFEEGSDARKRSGTVAFKPDGPFILASRVTRWPQLNGSVLRVENRWKLANDLSVANQSMTRGAGADENHAPDQQSRYVAIEEQFSMTAANAPRPTSWPAANFVPEILLPRVLAQPIEKPMILRTECSLIAEGAELSAPLTLVVEPVAKSGRRLNNSPEPMRCVSVSINGTGEITRWYFDEKNSLCYIEFAAGVRANNDEPIRP